MIGLAPCPICGSQPKLHEIKTGFVLSCVGKRHTVAVTDDGYHATELYRGKTEAELIEHWNKKFGGGQYA